MVSNAQPPNHELANDTFEREIDPSIISARTLEPVAKEDVLTRLKELAAEVAIEPKHLTVSGPPLARSFTVHMDGEGMLAARRVKKVIESMRTRSGWRRLDCGTPVGSETQLFIELDKSPKTLAEEREARRMRRALDKVASADSTTRWRRKDCTIILDEQPLARPICTPTGVDLDYDTKFEWNNAAVEKSGINKEALLKTFSEEKAAANTQVQWG